MTSRIHRRSAAQLLAAVILTLVALIVPKPTPAPAASPVIGAGSSFAALLVDQWRADTNKKPYSLDFNYQNTGSSQGRLLFAQNKVDFAVSDIPFQAGESPSRPFKYITAVAGALGFMYNLKDVGGRPITTLQLSPDSVCRIFTTPGIKWNDPAIQADNPTIAQLLPDLKVTSTVRADGSGTSYVLMQYCIATAPQVWATFVDYAKNAGIGNQEFNAGRPSSAWPVYPGAAAAPLSDGVAQQVAQTPGAITYIESGYGALKNLPNAKVRNSTGVYVDPSPSGITSALKFADSKDDGTFELDFAGNDQTAYFPSTYSYMIVPTSGLDDGKGETLYKYLEYAFGAGQARCEPLDYARLSSNLITKGLQTATQIPGAKPSSATTTTVGATTTTASTSTTRSTATTATTATTVAGGGNTATTRATVPAPAGAVTTTTRAGAIATTATTRAAAAGSGGGTVAPPLPAGDGSTIADDGTLGEPTDDGVVDDPGAVIEDPGAVVDDPGAVIEDPGAVVDGEVPPADDGLITDTTVILAGPVVAAPTDAISPPSAPGPSNSDALWTLMQGGLIACAGFLVHRARTRAV